MDQDWSSFGARFGALVKHKRGINGLSQEALAALAFEGGESSKGRISELETGKTANPHQRTIDALVLALGITDEELQHCRDASARLEQKIDAISRLPDEVRRQISEELAASRRRGLVKLPAEAAPPISHFADRPTALLIARHRVVPFLDRGQLAALIAWLEPSGRANVAGKLVAAPGGFGKTRLAIELVEEATARGWLATFSSPADAQDPASSIESLLPDRTAAGILIVLDYADEQIERLRGVVQVVARLETIEMPVRVLALARSHGEWWRNFIGETEPRAIFEREPDLSLTNPMTRREREALLELAQNAFRSMLGTLSIATGTADTRWSVDLERIDRPLAALAKAYLLARGTFDPDEAIFETLYREERNHWRRALRVDAADDPAVEDVARAAVQLTLIQGTSPDGGDALLEVDNWPRERSVRSIVSVLRRLYPHPETDFGSVDPEDWSLGMIEPDLLGEHIAMRVLSRDRRQLLSNIFRASLQRGHFTHHNTCSILTVLRRSTHPDHTRTVQNAARAGINALRIEVGVLPPTQLLHLIDALPARSTALGDLHHQAIERLQERVNETSGDDTPLDLAAQGIALLGVTRLRAGRGDYSSACDAAEAALQFFRRCENSLDVGTSKISLINLLAIIYFRLGRVGDARVLHREAQAWADTCVPVQSPDLYIKTLEISHSFLGLDGASEARALLRHRLREIYAAMAASDPGEWADRMAGWEAGLAGPSSESGRGTGSTQDQEEEVARIRAQVVRDRDLNLHTLPPALMRLARAYTTLGRPGDAVSLYAEQIQVLDELNRAEIGAYEEDLVEAHTALGDVLSAQSKFQLAADSFSAALEIAGRNLTDGPQAFQYGRIYCGLCLKAGMLFLEVEQPEDAIRVFFLGIEKSRFFEGADDLVIEETIGPLLQHTHRTLMKLGEFDAALHVEAKLHEIYVNWLPS